MNIIGQLTYNVTINDKNYSSLTKEQLISDVFSVASPGKIPLKKIGIQAPIGTIVNINGQDIMIGKTEIYENIAEIAITSLYFPEEKNYNLLNIIIDFAY